MKKSKRIYISSINMKVAAVVVLTTIMLSGCSSKVVQVTNETNDANDISNINDTSMMNNGAIAPAFSLMDTEGVTKQLSDFAGQKVYVKFWASWCPICLAGLEDVQTLAAKAEGYTVLTIVTPDASGEKDVEGFKTWFKGLDANQFTVLLDEGGNVAKEYGVRGFPTSAYIGTDGVLVSTIPGHQDNEAIMEKLEIIQ